jgi:serine/threonine-protein kinase RsbT
MSDVISEDRFAVSDDQSMMVALAMLRRRLLELNLSELLISRLMTVSSELAVNVLKYATRGTLFLKQLREAQKRGVEISLVDEGPGIPDVEQALQDHFSSKGTLGLGLPGVKRMVDDFRVESEVGKGTRVSAIVWL